MSKEACADADARIVVGGRAHVPVYDAEITSIASDLAWVWAHAHARAPAEGVCHLTSEHRDVWAKVRMCAAVLSPPSRCTLLTGMVASRCAGHRPSEGAATRAPRRRFWPEPVHPAGDRARPVCGVSRRCAPGDAGRRTSFSGGAASSSAAASSTDPLEFATHPGVWGGGAQLCRHVLHGDGGRNRWFDKAGAPPLGGTVLLRARWGSAARSKRTEAVGWRAAVAWVAGRQSISLVVTANGRAGFSGEVCGDWHGGVRWPERSTQPPGLRSSFRFGTMACAGGERAPSTRRWTASLRAALPISWSAWSGRTTL